MWWVVGAWAGTVDFEVDAPIEGELLRPEAGWVLARAPLGPAAAVRLEGRAVQALAAASEAELRGRDGAELRARARALQEEALSVRLAPPGPRAAGDWVGVAQLLGDLRRDPEATAAWERALAAEPGGRWAATARLALADRAFDRADLVAAGEGYRHLLADPSLGPYAAYKLAWCEWNLGDLGGAAARFAALASGPPGPLATEARRDLARAAASLPDPRVLELVGRACATSAPCRDEVRGRVDEARREVGLPPLP